MTKTFEFNLAQLMEAALGEVELLSYMVKLELLVHSIPVIVDPLNIGFQPFEVETGTLDWIVDTDTFTLKVTYEL